MLITVYIHLIIELILHSIKYCNYCENLFYLAYFINVIKKKYK